MIDSFKVKADTIENRLLIQLRGYFMKSELELAFYLARKESKKLSEGYNVILDLDGMYTDKNLYNSIQKRLRKIFITLGANSVKSVGAIPNMTQSKTADLEYFPFESVGFYPN